MPWPAAWLQHRLPRYPTAALPGILVVTLLLVAFVVGMLLQTRADVSQQADKDALNMARATAQDIARDLELYDLSLRTVVRQMESPAVQALSPELRQALLFPGTAHDARFGFINALNEKGDVVADSASLDPPPRNFAGRDYFRAQRTNSGDTVSVGRPFLTDPGQPTMIALSRRMVHPDQSFAGVVVGSIRVAYFAEVFARLPIGAHGAIALLRDDGMLLQRLPSVPGAIGGIPATSFTGLPPDRPADAMDPIDHRLRRVVLHRVDNLPLLVAVGMAPEDIYAAWWTLAKRITLPVCILGLLNTGMLAALRRSLATAERRRSQDRAQALELREFAEQRKDVLARDRLVQRRRAERLAQVSHDMRTLMQAITANAELLRQNGPLNTDQAQGLQTLRGASEHLRNMTELFLQSARLDADMVHRAATDIRAVIERCRAMVSLAAEQKGLQLTSEADASLPALVLTDEARLGVVLWNLLDNAVKYTQRGAVRLHASAQAGRLRFVITDTGCGMPPDAVRELQEPGSSMLGKPAGLAIVREHTAALGGTIVCMPKPGGGSIVGLELPADAGVSGIAGDTPSVPPLRILLVDDSALGRESVAELLRAAGHQVSEASSGEQAVQRVAQGAFDIVLMDMRMPGIGGLAAARCIRGLPRRFARLPIVLLTAGADDLDRTAYCDLGIGEPVRKPCDLASLSRGIADAIARQQADAGAETHDAAEPGRSSQVELFSEEVRDLLAKLDSPAAAETAHLIMGDAAQLGFYGLADCCRQFETAARDGASTASCRAGLLQGAVRVLERLPIA